MFQKILIANRGEIAVRVIRACRELGIASVAVYSDADRGALHVRMADEAFRCGPARASDSYLDAAALLAIARRAGVDAVHPGYGFLSENGDFADACAKRGVTFIGPSPAVLRSMGDKVTSRRIMQAAGVPVVPGSSEVLGDEEAVAFALEIGLPVMIKASGGGGGRGLRVVSSAKELRPAIERARSEAKASFGSDAIYVEKRLEAPRHIEVQLLADAHGRTVHLFERECSIQRRHQKLLEEAPACGIAPALREAMGAAAIAAARAVGYVGAGTVEFLLDGAGASHGAAPAFYFLEMNTRIQVEHPVTEAITRIDIVKEMIRVAAGEPLSFSQPEVVAHGHAIEARIYAEDPARNFLPSPGTVEIFRPPDGPGVRVDAGVQAGDVVTPHYDALLAKLVAWGASRDEALARLDRALSEFAIAGVKTSTPFHRQLLRFPEFATGRYDTGCVDRMPPQEPPRTELLPLAAALVATASGSAEEVVMRVVSPKQSDPPLLRARVERREGAATPFTAWVNGTSLALDAFAAPGGAWSVLLEGRPHEAHVARRKNGRFEVQIADNGSSSGRADFVLEVIPLA
jgi:acetyl-CoA carboxylase biotin carboxylase subunit